MRKCEPPGTLHSLVRPGVWRTRGGGAQVSDENAMPPQVGELFLELEGVLEDARDRLVHLLREAIPVQPQSDAVLGDRVADTG